MIFYRMHHSLKQLFSEGKLYASRKDFTKVNSSADEANRIITNWIKERKPFIVSRFGNVELEWYYQMTVFDFNLLKRIFYFLSFKTNVWRKGDFIIKHKYFIPSNLENSLFFKRKMDEVIPEIDLLASWSKGENSNIVKLKSNLPRTYIFDIEPYRSDFPWTLALEGKKVLVVNPMVHLFIEQMKNREKLFSRPMLPNFEIVPLKALFFGDPNYPEWKDVYNYYEEKIKSLEYDIAIIGCGTWGMPICNIVKSMGKGAIHLGGATQLLFGVMGKRWKDWPEYAAMINEYWITEHKEKPLVANQIEGGCYW